MPQNQSQWVVEFKLLTLQCFDQIQIIIFIKSANMEIENPIVQDQNEIVFIDYLARQPNTNHKDFVFDIDNYRAQYPQAAQQLIRDPSKYYVLIKKYLEKSSHQNQQKRKTDSKVQHYNIRIQGNLGANFVTPRGLNSRMANQLVGIQGIITKMELTKFYLQKSVHYNDTTKTVEMREYPDSFNPQKDGDLNRARTIKSYDDNGNPLAFEYGNSTFKDSQMVVIQQLPDMAPPGLLPMSVPVVLQNSLVASVKPGDRVQMIGIYKLISGMNTKQKGIFRPFFLCLSVKPLSQTANSNKKPEKLDVPQDKLYDLFSRSVAPSVWGHQYLKKAVLLMLIGGVQKVLENGTHLRGDVNVLMVGDPGTAKSQILRWVMSSVDVSVGTTGSGASGVGLTAAIVSDKDTGEKTLQAGAMVLADRGVVCIDQFDKMNETDRVAVHEVMEQQTVTIAKAGLHCSLNARCAVIAAANPIYGEYQINMPPTKNIGMPDSLLSRFDLVFIILDEKNAVRDKQIAQKVCRNHRLAPLSNDFMNQYMDADEYVVNPIEDKKGDDSMFQKNNVYKGQGKAEILSQTYLKRYINHVKQTVVPELTDESVKLSAGLWNRLRQKDFNDRQSSYTKVLPITIRTYESLIRLSTAHAKLLQSPYVETRDVIQGFKLMAYCLYGQENAMQDDLQQLLKELDIDYEYQSSKQTMKKIHKIYEPKEEANKMEPEDMISSKFSKLNFKENERQADKVLSQHVNRDPKYSNDERVIVYKAFNDMIRKKKGNQKFIKFDQLFEAVRKVLGPKQKLTAILQNLESENKVGMEQDKIFMV